MSKPFEGRQIALPADYVRRLLPELAGLGIAGGASHDVVIAITAREHDAELVTSDARARRTYDLVGARARLLSGPDRP